MIKFDDGKTNRYKISYWPIGNKTWLWESDIIDTKEEFEQTLLHVIEEFDLSETNIEEDICIFKLMDTPRYELFYETKTVTTKKIRLIP